MTSKPKRPRDFKHQWLSSVARSSLDLDVRGLLLAIAEQYMNLSGMNVWAAQARIATDCLGSDRARKKVNRLLGEAEAAGWIRWEYRPNHLGETVRHMTPIVPESGQAAIPNSGLVVVPESGHEPTGLNPEVVEPSVAPSGEGPRVPRSAGRPIWVGGTGIPDEELLISEDDAQPSHDPGRLDLSAVALAEKILSRHDDTAIDQVRELLTSHADPAEMLARIRDDDDHEAQDFVAVADLFRSLNTNAAVSAADVVDLLDLGIDLIPDQGERTEVFKQAATWSGRPYIACPRRAMEERLLDVIDSRAVNVS